MQIPAVFASLAMLAVGLYGAPPASMKPIPVQKQAPPVQKATKPPARPDSAIEAAIKAKFAKSKIGADKFEVHVQGGVAVIDGRTDVMQHKGVATRLARTGGAVAVNNRIQISEAARAKAAANLEKGRRRAQIKRGDTRSEDRVKVVPR